jgi:hypothetical protein
VAALDTAALLAQYRPVVQYDSLESYYTDWAAVISDRPGNELKRADGTVIAAAGPNAAGVPELNLAFLSPNTYANGEAVLPTDFIVEVGTDYVNQARLMHGRPGYANKCHGHVVEQLGVTWIQYWFFMYYDDPGFLGAGTHEGDIEMIQLRLGADGQPTVVTYAQHRGGVTANWDQVEQQGSSPVVYSARGTHASMLRAGDLVSDRSLLPDHNDAKGPRVQLDLVALSQDQTPWAFWPGHWGGTRPDNQVLGGIGVEANSPTAPNKHQAWSDPVGFHTSCEAADVPPVGTRCVDPKPAPLPPQIQVQPDPAEGVVHVKYQIPTTGGAAPATKLVLAVDSTNGERPPATTAIDLKGGSGQLTTPLVGDAGDVAVNATTHSADGAVSSTATATPSP